MGSDETVSTPYLNILVPNISLKCNLRQFQFRYFILFFFSILFHATVIAIHLILFSFQFGNLFNSHHIGIVTEPILPAPHPKHLISTGK